MDAATRYHMRAFRMQFTLTGCGYPVADEDRVEEAPMAPALEACINGNVLVQVAKQRVCAVPCVRAHEFRTETGPYLGPRHSLAGDRFDFA